MAAEHSAKLVGGMLGMLNVLLLMGCVAQEG